MTATPATATKTYIIDNGRSYSDHRIFFVEADPAQFDPLWAAYEKAWPDVCRRCGKVGESGMPKCVASVYHVNPDRFSLVAVVDSLTWRDASAKMTLAAWLGWHNCNFQDDTDDIAAAEEFRRLGRLLYSDFLNWMPEAFELRTYK